MSYSQFCVLSPRGDSIIYRDFRHDVSKATVEIFFRNCKFWNGKNQEAPPVFNLDGINYLYIKKNGLFFVFTTRDNVSPSLGLELLTRLTKLFKDYCGVLSEESIRTNFILVYELLDEIIDFGYPQVTNTEQIKRFVFNQPILVKSAASAAAASTSTTGKIFDINPKTTPSTSVDKPIHLQEKSGTKRKNEIFVDIYERISITFNTSGLILNSNIDGTIQMKSYLAGNPELKLALNEDLVIGKVQAGSSGGGAANRVPTYAGGAVEIDDCNFHECARLTEFDHSRILSFQPPDGEFILMNYRITGDTFRPPFRLFPFFELISPYKVELIIKLRADIPESNYGGNVTLSIPLPKSTSSTLSELPIGAAGQSTEYDAKDRKVIWRIKKFQGGQEQTLRCKITLASSASVSIRKEIGPLALNFEIPMYNPSGLQVRYLRILENKNYNPFRWVRYVTRSSSYICRL